MGCVSSGPKAVYEPDVVAKAAAPPTATDVMTPRSIPKAPPITSTGLNQESVARSIVGNIKFTGLIGVGGYGRVYRAKWNGGDVAVKVVPRASWNEGSEPQSAAPPPKRGVDVHLHEQHGGQQTR